MTSVRELQEYWDTLARVSEGESIECISMPPWDDICAELPWRLHLVDGGYFSKKHHGYFGVYRLIGLASEGDVRAPATFNRICGQDKTGTLYIGKASNLSARLNQLRRRKGEHNAMRALWRLRLELPRSKLAIALLFTRCHPGFVERDLIDAYISSFGDAPPLNYR